MGLTALGFTALPKQITPPIHTSGYVIPEYDEELELDIAAFYSPPHFPNPEFKFTQRAWDLVAEAGYNVTIPLWLDADSFKTNINTHLDRAYNAGIKVVVTDFAIHNFNDLYSESSSINIRYYKDHPAFYGLMLGDEIPIADWQQHANRIEYAKNLFPDKLIFSDTCELVFTWEQFCIDYLETVNPQIFCYDKYSMMYDGYTRMDYFTDMAIARYIAKNYGVPAWNFVLVAGHYNSYRNCSLEDIRWQMACYMAYGYEAFVHYCHNKDDNTYEEVFDEDDQPTDLYYRIKTANLEIRKWDYIYKSFNWQGTAAIIGSLPKSYLSLLNNIPAKYRLNPAAIDGVNEITATRDILAGIFYDANHNIGLMITNAENPVEQLTSDVTVEFDERYSGVMVFHKDMEYGKPEIINLNEGKLTLSLGVGEGKFLIPLIWR